MALTTPERLRFLGSVVESARLAAPLAKDTAAAQAEISPITWTRVEQGLTVRDVTYSAVERVLGWPRLVCMTYLRDGDEAKLAAAVEAAVPPAGDPVDLALAEVVGSLGPEQKGALLQYARFIRDGSSGPDQQ